MSKDVADQTHCLVVEDQALIAMSIEIYLEEAGMAVQAVSSSAEARAWREAHTADIAIVDFLLQDGPATELAAELNRRAIPFVIYSGYPPRHGLSSELQGVPWLEKPTSRDELLKVVLNTLMAVSGQAPSSSTLQS
ncbi:response regulator [Microvirga sp. VF16]|uniref:response regulator n=1 Tax=Microvirga sp. VF16 TaxID=2807101 RepID=UPI00193E089D|nr:response regulator [Microvirga sp. VF16]QRM32709.1 response regulator [Microvirga sp. VF16]